MHKEKKDSHLAKASWGFRLFVGYVRAFYRFVYFRKIHVIGAEKVPVSGPLLMVSDHQNGLNDVLSIYFSIKRNKRRKIRSLARADIITANSTAFKFVKWLGIMPAYRLDFEGESALVNNTDTIDMIREEMVNDGTVILFPEANHQTKHWFGFFSARYLITMFEAAKQCDFKKEMYVTPAANHYDIYHDIHAVSLIRYADPIPLSTWYDSYREKPKSTVREVNAIVKEKILSMMLNINDLDNYEAIDFIRNTYGIDYAHENGYRPNYMPDKLESDKKLVDALEAAHAKHPEEIKDLYAEIVRLAQMTRLMGISDRNAREYFVALKVLLQAVVGLALLPVFIVSMALNFINFGLPAFLDTKVPDKNMHCTLNIPTVLVAAVPLTIILMVVLGWLFTHSWLIIAAMLVAMPFGMIFGCEYIRANRRWLTRLRYVFLSSDQKEEWLNLRKQCFESLNKLL